MTNLQEFIPVAEPALVGNEKKYVMDCLESGWISSAGEYVTRFESAFAQFAGTRHAMACSNGTVALHLALLSFGIGPGDEVIVPAMTFVATANAVVYCGAKPVFADSESGSWNINPEHVDSLVTSRTRAIIAVHLFGLPADMDALQQVADRHGIPIVEDAAEAHGAQYQGRTAGSLGKVATFSFYGNKILTTGEGGMVTTDDDELAKHIRLLKGQGLSPDRRYWHPVVGYNYRLTNIAAAIGLAQLEMADWHIRKRKEVAKVYRDLLGSHPRITFQQTSDDSDHVYWMTSIVLRDADIQERDRVMEFLLQSGIETRPFFVPMHLLPMYSSTGQGSLPVSEKLAVSGISLPSSSALIEENQIRVAKVLLEGLGASPGEI